MPSANNVYTNDLVQAINWETTQATRIWDVWLNTANITTTPVYSMNDVMRANYLCNSTNTLTWTTWNGNYERFTETEEQARTRVLHSVGYLNGWTLVPSEIALLTTDERIDWEDRKQRADEERIERERQAQEVFEAEGRRRAEANRRAELLLTSLLSAEQKREWLEHKWVTEVAPSGKVFRLYPAWSAGVTIQAEDNPEVRRATLCVHPAERVPDCDSMVANLLHIRQDEDRLIQIAILHGGHFTPEELELRRARGHNVHERGGLRVDVGQRVGPGVAV